MTNNRDNGLNIDALLPPEMALKAEAIGIKKARMGLYTTFALAILAGAFIALGAVFSTTVTAGSSNVPFGIARLLGGLVFSLGLILVIIGGAELFTGNNLIVMAWANGKVSSVQLIRNWLIVYVGNFVGALSMAVIMFFSGQYLFGNGQIGANALAIANAKAGLDMISALVLGLLGNTLVCLAVWLAFSARSTTDKILSIIFPVTAFVTAGFEHSIANMYFIPIGLLIKDFAAPDFWTIIGKTSASYPSLTWSSFLVNNLIPVTVGNVLGGTLMVGIVYWFIYLRPKRSTESPHVPRGEFDKEWAD